MSCRVCLYPKIPSVDRSMTFLKSIFCISKQKHQIRLRSAWKWVISFFLWLWFLLWFCSSNQISISAFIWLYMNTVSHFIQWCQKYCWNESLRLCLCSFCYAAFLLGMPPQIQWSSVLTFTRWPVLPRKLAALLTFLFLCVYVCVCSSESQTWASW